MHQLAISAKHASMPATISERIRVLRARARENQDKIAELAGVSQSLVGKWERGESLPDAEQVRVLAQHWNVSADYLVGLSMSPTGLDPDTFLVDLEAWENGPRSEVWWAKIPRRHRIVDFAEWQKMREIPRADRKRT